ncbi:GH25 family lysozyme [Lactobacillus kalixensis]|nr:GH25 family lysozyme [Lactobacillus kalixensis]
MTRFHHKYTLPMILTLLVLAIAGLIVGWFNFKRQTTLPSNSNTSAIGVELTQKFDYVDLHKLQANNVSFIYLRSTQGRSYFDDDYLSYRDQVQGTNLAFGTIVAYSNESTARQHYEYFIKKVGLNTGSLPILIEPAVESRSRKYLNSMADFTQMLMNRGKSVAVLLNYRYHKFFPVKTKFVTDGKYEPDKVKYAFWRYTTDGRVKNVSGLEDDVTMFSYNGTVAQYKQKYGQLTQ